MAEEAKARGNAAFSSGNYDEAIRHFTEAINLAQTNHVLYSNRSASYASLNQFFKALSDAQTTVQLKPDWSKGYSRLGAAQLGLHRYDDAVSAYEKGIEIDPDNEALRSGLNDAKSAKTRSGPFRPDMWIRLSAEPSTRGLLQQPDFIRRMQDIQKNPGCMNMYMEDHRVLKAFGILCGFKTSDDTNYYHKRYTLRG